MAQYSAIVGKPANSKETAPRRHYRFKDAPLKRPLGYKASTVYELAVEAVEKGGLHNTAMGWRNVIDIHEKQKLITKVIDGKETKVEKNWMYFEMSDYNYITYGDISDNIHCLGRGLVKLGLRHKSDDKLHIYAGTSQYWLQTFLGAQSQSIPVVTAYDTLGEKGLTHSILQTESTAIFTDNSLLPTLINPLKNCPTVKYVIHSEKIDSKDKRQNGKIFKVANNAIAAIKEVRPDIVFITYPDLIALGKKHKDSIQVNPPTPDDLSCIMYTSGSTGDPKGVVLTHRNIIAGVAGISSTVDQSDIHPGDRVICFLPLAHIFEICFELISLYWGAVIGYSSVKTLTSTSMHGNCQGDLALFKPTLMVGVAAVWETVRKGIIAQVGKLPSFSQKVFWSAYFTKQKLEKYHLPGSNLIGKIIFKKIRAATGGHLRIALNGGSPISTDAQSFISNTICPLLLGYGLTETCANGTVSPPEHFTYGVAGDLAGAITVKLVDVEELNYFAKNNQGEILMKGDSITKEYFKNKEETEKAFDSEGWFRTGDIGEWTSNGQLKIIDRKKNLVKTQNGEYIALEKLESIYRSNKYVNNICVYADQSKVKPIGIIEPNLPAIIDLATSLNIYNSNSTDDISNHFHNKKLKSLILQDMLKTGKSQGLVGIENLQNIVIFDGEWTPQSGFVTSAAKLKRRDILNAVKDQVDEAYKS
ncbi:hypothetical protein TBLA_0D00660 [Henningerozyma blattae CBS 6284]|uniref:AMP-dependent synthetase/ligase domain-containing protein n=1 Tax=Henningerozyma blattae (strain ATCC 34711 / CBS 6284 / DSM 70876 / NBRC 10599 / NRRL Y-10934 / UCD 77-7) TaxID=1071380 RepID=I2H2H1_HENB6|nr:hypothetical protein TBLA_0D00660 [Tetrapisispora blattae CBS 6284]CCH60573.1 hypothetical protein TBLA_0D00660 [Tetrapisispora blattae CBS 6284]